ncbi:MAG: hypothetical protein P8Y68_17780, partial [Anaerolineales bacterium]
MTTLLQSLQKHDLGHLHILAEGWDISLQAPDVRQGRKELAKTLLGSKQQIEEMIQDLPAESQSALSDLLGQQGQILWHLFTRRYGEVREMGPGRRDREKPYLSPTSTTEQLWYLGMIARDFFDSPAGPQEYAYLPEDLIPLMPSFLHTSGAVTLLSRPATPTERAYPVPVNDQILDHATTLLAALRMAGGEIFPEQLETFRKYWSIPPEVLTALLRTAGILDEEHIPLPDQTRDFLEAPRPQSLAILASAWLNSPDFDDLAMIPHISAAGEYTPDPLGMRQSALELLQTLPTDQWWRLPALISSVRTQQPNFLRPKGDYDTWYLKDLRNDQFLRGIEHLDQVEGEYLRFLLTGPMHW